MLKVHKYQTVNADWLDMVFSGMRNSWESWQTGDSIILGDSLVPETSFILGEKDKDLALRLTKTGTDHGKYLRQIPIIFDFEAPNYFFKEFDTYVVGVCVAGDVTQNSTSQMHVLGKHPFSVEMFCFEDIDIRIQTSIIDNLNYLRDRWIDEGGKKKGPKAYQWRAMVQAIPDSWIYRRTVKANYQVLRDMYLSRCKHRLTEWREFCTWIETLPHNELITTK